MSDFMQDQLAATISGKHEFSDTPYSVIQEFRQESDAQLAAQRQRRQQELATLGNAERSNQVAENTLRSESDEPPTPKRNAPEPDESNPLDQAWKNVTKSFQGKK